MRRSFRAAAIVLPVAGVVFLVSSVGMANGVEPFHTWYYLFAWWSYIFLAESLLWVKGGRSVLFERPREFLVSLPLSICFWLVFELFNFRLQNWHYVGVPAERALRWMGYALSFATVLPGLQATTHLLDRFSSLGKTPGMRRRNWRRYHPRFVAVGIFCLLGPLWEPTLFFPLVWVGFALVLDPVNHRLGAPSLLGEMEAGSYKLHFQLPVSGLCCGLIWESCNYWAGGRWAYTLPYFEFLRFFEMPVLGFLGFLPFSIEAFVMSHSARLAIEKISGGKSAVCRVVLWSILAFIFVVFVCLVFSGIDRFTVHAYRP